VHAGAQSRWSCVTHGVLLLMSVFALTALLNLIPLACLAAILIFTGLKLAKPALFSSMAKQGIESFAPFIVTIAGVVLTDLLIGIVLGIACSVAIGIRASLHRPMTVAHHDGHVLLTFRKDVASFVKVELKQQLARIPDNATLSIDGRRADFIDPDVREMIDAFAVKAPARGIHVECRGFAQAPADAKESARRMPMFGRTAIK
jgi:MFS superfamily sulfate permease-like transporter